MARGGLYDQLGGGFARYSVDDAWVVPHFEKMLYDNAGLLNNYVHAFQSFVGVEMARVAKDIIRFMDTWLSDRDRGGFFSSQDANINLDDDGDYFTWTKAEAAAVLTPEEMAIAAAYYDIGDLGDMHHDPAKNVLHVKHMLDAVASKAGTPLTKAQDLLAAAHAKLYAARGERPTPFVDTTMYTGWNALAVSAYFEAAQVLRLEDVKAFARLTLDRLLSEGLDAERGLAHVIAYGKWIPGMLDDYAFTIHACLDGWLATGEMRYYRAAESLADEMIAGFYDETGGAFFDARKDRELLGVMGARRKPLQDSPTPAGNSSAAAALLRLEALNGRKDLREKAEDTLEAFAAVVGQLGLYAGSYGLALERLLLPPVQVVVIGEGHAADELEAAAIVGYAVNKSVIRLTHAQIRDELPLVLAETLPLLPELNKGHSFAVVCRGTSCLPPTTSPDHLQTLLQG
jgi:uncharacterized protein YyaL (SSP411 family)